jgi:hypothetical protein
MSNDKQAEQMPLSSSVSKDTSTQPHLPPAQPERLEVIIEAENNAESQESEPVTSQPVVEEEADDETRPLLAGNNQENSDDGLGITRYTTDPSERKGAPPAWDLWSTASSELLEALLQGQLIESLDEEDLEEGKNQLSVAEDKRLLYVINLPEEALPLNSDPHTTAISRWIRESSTILSILEPIERRLRSLQARTGLFIGCVGLTAVAPLMTFDILRARFGEAIFGSITDFLAQVLLFCIISGTISCWLYACTRHCAFRLSTAEEQALERFNLFDLQDEQSLEWYLLTSTNLFRHLVELKSALQTKIPVSAVASLVLEYTLPNEPDEFITEIQRILSLPREVPEPQPSTEEAIIETKEIAAPSIVLEEKKGQPMTTSTTNSNSQLSPPLSQSVILPSAANDILITSPSSEVAETSIQAPNLGQTTSSSSTSSFFTRRAANQPTQLALASSSTQQTTLEENDSTEKNSPPHTKRE